MASGRSGKRRTRAAASVVLWRRRPELEVFLVLRSPELEFFGGYLAFPGGGAEDDDARTPLGNESGLDGDERLAVSCAARELREEVGVVVASPSGVVDASLFRALVRLETPRFSRVRYDTRFFLLELGAAQPEPRVASPELSAGDWWRPAAALSAWRRGEVLIAPPAIVILERLALDGVAGSPERLRALPVEFEGSGLAIPWTPGLEIVPLETPPLPPTIPTNAFLVGGRRFVLIDPAPSGDGEKAHLLSSVERRLAAGDRLDAVVLSHHHVDHVGALEETVEAFDAPVWGHPLTGKLLERRLDRELHDGAWIDLGTSPDGSTGWGLHCLFTPGHARGHLAFLDSRYGVALVGDLVSTLVSMYVGEPGGHIATYMESLERVRRRRPRLLVPSHGMPTTGGERLLTTTVAHRLERIEQVHALLDAEPRSVDEVASQVYGAKDPRLQLLFERTTRAALRYLVEQGRAEDRGEDRFSRASTGR